MLVVAGTMVATAVAATYAYDALGRLVRVKLDDGAQLDYAYDATGNFAAVRSATVPGAPVLRAIRPGQGRVTLVFEPPSNNGGAEVSDYTASCQPENGGALETVSGQSPLTVSGLANGVWYSCSVQANNEVGGSPASTSLSRRVGAVNVAPLIFQLLLDE
jgi:YD repeat-containing protein